MARTPFLSSPYNVKGGKMYGVELAGTLPFGEFDPARSTASASPAALAYTKSDRVFSQWHAGAPQRSPGLFEVGRERHALFRKVGLHRRGKHPLPVELPGRSFGLRRQTERLRRALPETIFDAQVGYDFQPGSMLNGLSVYLQAQNLTDEPFRTVDDPG